MIKTLILAALVALGISGTSACSITLYSHEWDRQPSQGVGWTPTQAECDEYPETTEPAGCERHHWK